MFFNKRPKVLVTGASGLVGGAIAERLQENFEVISPGRLEMDLLDCASVSDYIDSVKPEICVHAAALVMGLGGNLTKPSESLRKNTLMDLNLFTALEHSSVRRLLYVSTVAAYGYPYTQMPLIESDFFIGAPHEGEYGYASAKRLGHAHAEGLFKTAGVYTSYLVLTNVFGPNDRFNVETGHVIPSLISKAHSASTQGKPLSVWGKPTTMRDFIFSEDVAIAVERLIPRTHHGIVNVSTGFGVEMSQVAEVIRREFALPEINWQSDQPVGITKRVVANQTLKELIDFEPQDFELALTNTIRWFQTNKERARI